MPRAHRAPPPLAKARHACVVARHLLRQADHPPARLAQPLAKLVILGGDHMRIEPARLAIGAAAHHHVTAAGRNLARRAVPFVIAKRVIDRRVGGHLGPPAGDEAKARIVPQGGQPRLDPALDHRAIAIDELHAFGWRLPKRLKPLMPRPRGGEGCGRVELHHLRPRVPRHRHAVVGRAAIDIDQPVPLPRDRGETGTEPRPFVAPDDDDGEPHPRSPSGGVPAA